MTLLLDWDGLTLGDAMDRLRDLLGPHGGELRESSSYNGSYRGFDFRMRGASMSDPGLVRFSAEPGILFSVMGNLTESDLVALSATAASLIYARLVDPEYGR